MPKMPPRTSIPMQDTAGVPLVAPEALPVRAAWRSFRHAIIINILALLFALTGLCIWIFVPPVVSSEYKRATQSVGRFVFSGGLYSFLGGGTNWLALKMMFDRIPCLYGSGVIPRRFKQIREALKETVLRTFFDVEYLHKFVSQKTGRLGAELQLEGKLKTLLESQTVEQLIDLKLKELSYRPEGLILSINGVGPSTLRPVVKPFLLGLGAELAPAIFSILDPTLQINVETLRTEIDRLLNEKMVELTPRVTTAFIEDVVRDHLSWIIVWGNIIGFFLGVLAEVGNSTDFLHSPDDCGP